MKRKLYANIRRMTNLFCVCILAVTLSILALRLTAFSDMATASPQNAASHILVNEEDGYQLNSKIYYPTSHSKGDVFITNLEGNEYIIKVDITLSDTKESVLYTGFINPGVSTDSKELNSKGQKLKEGIYNCVAEIIAHDPDTLKKVSSTTEQVQIYIGTMPGEEDGADKGQDQKDKDTEQDV